MLGPTVVWTLLIGIPLIFGITKAATDPRWLLHQLRALISVTVLLGFMVNVRTFHLVVEFLLQGLIGFLVVLAAVASIRPEHRVVERAFNSLLGIIGLLLVSFGTIYLVSGWTYIDWHQLTRDLLMPFWLGTWGSVFVAVLGVYSNLEKIFRHMARENPSWIDRFCRILPLALRAGHNPRTIRNCHGYWYNKIVNAFSLREARQVVKEFLQFCADREAAKSEAAQKLIDNAGLKGVDEEGAQLDQREFKETWNALETIMLWFHGWYGKNAKGYDLAKIKRIMELHDFKGLPEDHGITTHVSQDGESCYSMRKTVSGRILAVGMHGHNFRRWYWDGNHEPTGYPGKGGDWGTDWFTLAFNPNR
ncbi:hypothetical protein [Halomonas salipaludis]|uniref:hypothetical protein n=1 Tax=Halomonas salipaludis TaxID=2032625 RepID=UPI001140B3FD|nr:hypothetical protein [Halomonas salipaludis]